MLTAPATVDAGVGTGDAAAVINDDDNPLATLGGQDTGTERAIVDDENPLYSGFAQDVATSGSGMALVAASGRRRSRSRRPWPLLVDAPPQKE